MKIANLVIADRSVLGVVDVDAAQFRPFLKANGASYAGPDFVALVEQVTACGLENVPLGSAVPLSLGILKAPIPSPRRNIFCVGKNYHAHVREFSQSGYDASTNVNDDIPSRPVVFTKATTSIIGHEDEISCHGDITQALDYEAEMAVIIGLGGCRIRSEEAARHIFGYSIVNDVTARDLQKAHNQWFLGKSLDTFCPLGPWIVSADELNPNAAQIRCWVNDELRQDANTSQMIFAIPKLIETISAGVTLLPGDIIATGTPAGVGIGYHPPKFLRSGDRIVITISGIGTLANTVT